MKCVIVSVTLCALVLASGCVQSPARLMAEANKYHNNKKYDEASILYQKILIKDKTNAEAYYRLGLNLLEQRKGGEAAQAFRRAVDLKPANADAVAKLAEIYLAAYNQNPKTGKGLVDDIKQLDGKLLQQDPNGFEGLRIQGLIAVMIDQDLPKAEASFAKANRVKPYSRELVNSYAETLVGEGKSDQAISLVNDMLAHDKTWDAGYNLLTVLYLRAGQKDKVDGILRQHVEADPASSSAIVNYAGFKQKNNDFAGAEQLMQRLTKDPKTFPSAQMLAGDFYFLANKPEQAKAAYEQGLKDEPGNSVQYGEKLVAIQAATKNIPQALAMAKDLVDKNPKDGTATDLYAELLLRTNTRETSAKTIDEIKKMVDNNPANASLRLNLGKAYFEGGDREKCLTALQQVVGDVQKDQQRTGHMQRTLQSAQILEARILGERGDNAKALELTGSVLSGDIRLSDQSLESDARLIRDRALVATSRGSEAQPDLEDLLKHYPNMAEAHILLADVLLARGQFDKATEQYATAAKGNAPDRRALVGLQTVKLFSGHFDEAIQNMQDMVSKYPADAGLRFQLAKFESTAAIRPPNANQPAGLQLLQQAEDNYKQIVATNPATRDDVWMNLATVQRALGQNDAALASFQQAGAVNPKNDMAFLEQALILETLNRKKEAIDDYNRVLSIRPDNPIALNNLAMISAENGVNLDQAQTYAERAKKGAPDSPAVADTLGYVYLQKNLNTQATEIFRENVQKYPESSAFRFHLAMALLKQGDKQGAKQQANKALQGAPSDLQGKIKAFVGQIG